MATLDETPVLLSHTKDSGRVFTGVLFLAAAAMLWLGWMLLPVRPGSHYQGGEFALIHEQLYLWIWLYRVHIFGMVTAAMALAALAASLANSPARVVVWPGVTPAVAGMFVSALAAAFYYHHGAWGAILLAGKPSEQAKLFADSLLIDTEYVTCLVRFGRVFTGLGLVTLCGGLLAWRVLPAWVGVTAGPIGLAAMAITMGKPDRLDLYMPVFHCLCAWLALTGVAVLLCGISTAAGDGKGAGVTSQADTRP
jgi:hypothetical protein